MCYEKEIRDTHIIISLSHRWDWFESTQPVQEVSTSVPAGYDNVQEQPGVMSHQDITWLFRCQFHANIWNVTSITCLFKCMRGQTPWSKRAKHSSLLHSAVWRQHREPRLGCSAFSQVQVDVTEVLPADFFFMWWSLEVMCSRNGRRGGIPRGERGNSFICRLPSCLQQIFHKVLRFWQESKNQLHLVLSCYFILYII